MSLAGEVWSAEPVGRFWLSEILWLTDELDLYVYCFYCPIFCHMKMVCAAIWFVL